MKTTFDLLSKEYKSRCAIVDRLSRRYSREAVATVTACAAMCLICLAFLAFTWYQGMSLRAEAVRVRALKDRYVEKVSQLNKEYHQLREIAAGWEKLAVVAESSIPVVQILVKLKGLLPGSAEINTFSADGRSLHMNIKLDDVTKLPRLLRQLEGLPYGPFRVQGRRNLSRKSALVELEAERRK